MLSRERQHHALSRGYSIHLIAEGDARRLPTACNGSGQGHQAPERPLEAVEMRCEDCLIEHSDDDPHEPQRCHASPTSSRPTATRCPVAASTIHPVRSYTGAEVPIRVLVAECV